MSSESLDKLLSEDGEMAAWWGTWAECAVTISRLKRDGDTVDRSFVCLDRTLRRAATDEGFDVLPGAA